MDLRGLGMENEPFSGLYKELTDQVIRVVLPGVPTELPAMGSWSPFMAVPWRLRLMQAGLRVAAGG